MRCLIAIPLAAALLAGAAATQAAAQQADLLALGAGAYNVFQDKKEAQFRLEYRPAFGFFDLVKPIVGAFVTDHRSVFGYAGLRADVPLGEHIMLTPEVALGYWNRGTGKDLGGPFEFKTGGEFAWRFADQSRLGLLFDHISNAGIYRRNPGVESLLIVYSLPIGAR
jgi:lipid A 3-O-deacylase